MRFFFLFFVFWMNQTAFAYQAPTTPDPLTGDFYSLLEKSKAQLFLGVDRAADADKQRELELARTILTECERALRKSNLPTVSVDDLWAEYHYRTGNKAEMRRYALEFIKKQGKNSSRTAQMYYLLGLDTEDDTDALRHFQRALQALCHPKMDTGFLLVPALHQVHDHPHALRILTQKTKVLAASNLGAEHHIYEHLLACIALAEACVETEIWLPYSEDLFHSSEEPLLRQLFYAQAEPIYAQALQFALQRQAQTKDPIFGNDAFLIAERWRKFQYRFQLYDANGLRPDRFWGIPDTLSVYSRSLQKDYRAFDLQRLADTSAQMQEEWAALESQRSSVQTRIAQQYTAYTAWLPISRVAGIKEVQEALPDDSTAFLAYTDLGDTLTLFILTRNEVIIEQMPEAYPETGVAPSYIKKAYDYYHHFFPKQLPAALRRLLVMGIPEWSLPMEAWISMDLSKVEHPNYRELPYLLRQFSFSYPLSATDWLEQRKLSNKAVNRQLLALGAARGSGLDSSAVAHQLRWLSETFKGYFPDQASLNDWQVYAGEYGFLHLAFAMEGLDESNQLAFQLMDQVWKDGDLRAQQLRAALVALDGQLNEVYPAQMDWNAIAYRWLYAGAAAVVVPQFQRTHRFPSRILTHFYALLSEGMPKDQALRQAKLTHLSMAPSLATHPDFWAVYTLMGDIDPAEVAQPIGRIWWYIWPIAAMLGIGWWTMRGLRQRRRF